MMLKAGIEGFEPPNAGIRIQCLTAWRYPNVFNFCRFVSATMIIIYELFSKCKYFFNFFYFYSNSAPPAELLPLLLTIILFLPYSSCYFLSRHPYTERTIFHIELSHTVFVDYNFLFAISHYIYISLFCVSYAHFHLFTSTFIDRQ